LSFAAAAFRTDADIAHKSAQRRDRELQAWHPGTDSSNATNPAPYAQGDELTFGPGSNNTSWDQFAVNEKLFGVKASFDEDVYTTKLDRSSADFKERERKAQKIANEIIGVCDLPLHLLKKQTKTPRSLPSPPQTIPMSPRREI
jgi:PAB1-binding protein PBP1